MKIILYLTLFFVCGNTQNSSTLSESNVKSNIERPCEVFDTDCIRKYFAEHSKCKVVYGPVPDPLYTPPRTVFIPAINSSLVLENPVYRGFNGRVDKFYINKATDRLVLSVEFRNILLTSNKTLYIYYRRGKEPVVNEDYLRVFQRALTVTIIIPKVKDLQLQFGEVFGYSTSPEAIFQIGPNAFRGSDPGLQQAAVEFFTRSRAVLAEGLLTDASIEITSYIQYNICDFGLVNI